MGRIFGFEDDPSRARITKSKEWNELRLDEEINGPLIDQIKNIENEIKLPVLELDSIKSYLQLHNWTLRMQKAVRGTFRNYGAVKTERLCLLHFFKAIGGIKIDKEECGREKLEEYLKLILDEHLIKHYAKYRDEILDLVKWRLPSEK